MSWTRTRATVAGLHGRSPDDPELLDARRRLRVERAQLYIEKLVDGWPPLTEEQRCQLAAILRPVTGAAVGRPGAPPPSESEAA